MSTTATGYYYNAFRKKLGQASIDLDNDTLKLALVASTYTPDIDSDEFFSSVRSDEVSGTAYNPGGTNLSSQVMAQDDTNDIGTFDFANITWAAATLTGRYAVLWKPTLLNLNDGATYKWTASGSGTNEYYCELFGGGNPSLTEPQEVDENGVGMAIGTMGSLAAGEWDWGDNDALGYSTVYVRLSDGADPDSKASGYVKSIVDATSALLAYWDFGADISVSADNFAANVAAAGAFAF